MNANKPPDLYGDMSTGEFDPESIKARERRIADRTASTRLPPVIAGRSGVGCYCVQVRWFGRYRLIWPTKRTTGLWRRWTG